MSVARQVRSHHVGPTATERPQPPTGLRRGSGSSVHDALKGRVSNVSHVLDSQKYTSDDGGSVPRAGAPRIVMALAGTSEKLPQKRLVQNFTSRFRGYALTCGVADLGWQLGRVYFLAFLNPQGDNRSLPLPPGWPVSATVDDGPDDCRRPQTVSLNGVRGLLDRRSALDMFRGGRRAYRDGRGAGEDGIIRPVGKCSGLEAPLAGPTHGRHCSSQV